MTASSTWGHPAGLQAEMAGLMLGSLLLMAPVYGYSRNTLAVVPVMALAGLLTAALAAWMDAFNFHHRRLKC